VLANQWPVNPGITCRPPCCCPGASGLRRAPPAPAGQRHAPADRSGAVPVWRPGSCRTGVRWRRPAGLLLQVPSSAGLGWDCMACWHRRRECPEAQQAQPTVSATAQPSVLRPHAPFFAALNQGSPGVAPSAINGPCKGIDLRLDCRIPEKLSSNSLDQGLLDLGLSASTTLPIKPPAQLAMRWLTTLTALVTRASIQAPAGRANTMPVGAPVVPLPTA